MDMFEKRIPMEQEQRLTLVEVEDSARLDVWDEKDVQIRMRDGQETDLNIEQAEAGPTVSVRRACEVNVPAGMGVSVRQAMSDLEASGLADFNAEQVRGNLKLTGVDQAEVAEVYGNLKASSTDSLRVVGTVYGNAALEAIGSGDLQNVRGNLQARRLDRLRASRIGGNLRANEIGGTLDVDQVGGNALLAAIGGHVALDQVAGNLAAKDLGRGAKVARVGGNLALNGAVGGGSTYQFRVDGNAAVRLPEGVGAHITLTAKGKLQSAVALADEEREEHMLRGSLGDGGAEVAVEAGGNVLLASSGPSVGAEFGEEISRQVEASVNAIDFEAVGRQVEESLRAIDLESIGQQVSAEMEQALSRLRVKLESVDWDRMGHRAEMAVERAMDRMQRESERFSAQTARQQERLEQMAAREARRLERMERKLSRAAQSEQHRDRVDTRSAGETAEAMAPEPDLDEERLSILRMVEQGQITPEDAEMLLDALQ
jgi:hypothetical protein